MSEPKNISGNVSVGRSALSRARNKSWMDIENQRVRLINTLVDRYNSGDLDASTVSRRAEQVTNAAERYQSRIRAEQEQAVRDREEAERKRRQRTSFAGREWPTIKY